MWPIDVQIKTYKRNLDRIKNIKPVKLRNCDKKRVNHKLKT